MLKGLAKVELIITPRRSRSLVLSMANRQLDTAMLQMIRKMEENIGRRTRKIPFAGGCI